MIKIKNILFEQKQTLIPLNVLFIGDSQLASPDSFGRDLIRDKIIKGRVVAKDGASTSLMYKFLRDTYNSEYDVVVIMGGGNDSQNSSPNKAIQNLSAMYRLAQEGGSIVIAISNPTKDFTSNPDKYPSNDEIAKWVSLQTISNFTIDGNEITHNEGYFLRDKVHLNNSGHESIYDALIPVLRNIADGDTQQNNDVSILQKGLEKLGFKLGDEAESGKIGSKTKNAIKKLNKVYKKQQKTQTVSDSAMMLIQNLMRSSVVGSEIGAEDAEDMQTTSLSTGKVANPERTIMIFMKNKGLTTSQAAGIAGNLQSESQFDPNAVGDNGTSFGIAQWHKERFEQLKKWTKKNGLKWNSFDAQLQFLWWELQNSEANALTKLKLENDPKSAAYTFAKYFERPSEIASSRMENATRIYDTYTNDIIKRIE